ncbi:MAG: hypothetical protein HZY76_03330 [Anaerolineae bacterium]|nr:MAG: hypothetical protein HZY76_03330 [Anaerolineae bacterium]
MKRDDRRLAVRFDAAHDAQRVGRLFQQRHLYQRQGAMAWRSSSTIWRWMSPLS